MTVHGCAVSSSLTGCQVTSRPRNRLSSYSKSTDNFRTALVQSISPGGGGGWGNRLGREADCIRPFGFGVKNGCSCALIPPPPYSFVLCTETIVVVLSFFTKYTELFGDRGGTVVKVLCYKSEGRWFDLSWCHWNFSSFGSFYGPEVDSASNRNE